MSTQCIVMDTTLGKAYQLGSDEYTELLGNVNCH